ncbi:MAG: Rpn family recombination-promoting nuclease/putative transposase [Chitinivibrionia bacterium]|nr:Rpn family recombination-promoting nuclease/putative transposase [Chitinivibrionia bacterium]
MERTIISLDWAMKEILRDKANFGVLEGFLSELFNKKIVIENILESEGNIGNAFEKINRVDLKAKIDNGEIAVFEIQFGDKLDFLGKALFNACKAVIEQVSRGNLYDIHKVYSINIAYFDLGAKQEYIFHAKLTEFAGVHFDESIPFSQNLNPPLSPDVNIHPEYYLILPNKFDEKIRNKFDEWVYVLKNSTVKSEFTASGIQEAGEKLDVLKMTSKQRAAYEREREDFMSYKSELYTAELKGRLKGEAKGIEKGKAEGLAEGEAKKAMEVAKNLKNIGISLAQIEMATGLSTDEIEKL